jgi:hypothetical protein
MDRRRLPAVPPGEGDPMTTVTLDRQAGRTEGKRRKDDAHALLAARRAWLIRRARRALLPLLFSAETRTAVDVAGAAELTDPSIEPRWRDVRGPFSLAGFVKRIAYTKVAGGSIDQHRNQRILPR